MEQLLENWNRFIQEEKKQSTIDKERQRKRKKKVHLGTDELLNDLREKKVKRGPGCEDPGSPFHDEDGKFASPEEHPAGSWSCPDKKKKSRRGRSLRFTKNPCGRGAKHRCKDGSEKWEEGVENQVIDLEQLKQLISAELQDILASYEDYLDDQEQLLEQGNDKEMLKWCRRRGMMSLQRFLQIQDAFERSAKGDLNKKD